jgi:hypothetical protein
MAKAEYRPNPEPQWVRETLVEDYLGVARRNGQNPNVADVERLALNDLAVTEAVRRDDKPRAPKAKTPAPVDRVPQAARKAAGELGWEVTKRPIGQPRKSAFKSFMNKPPGNPKQAAAIMRLGQILSPKSNFRPSKEFDYVLPRLAQKFAETMQALDRGRGEYEGKSEIDCERITWRVVEDICDKSTGVLGPWWVR